MSLVLDGSAALAWLVPDEARSQAHAIVDAVVDQGAVTASLFHLEVANAVTVAVRRHRIDAQTRAQFLSALGGLDTAVDDHTAAYAWSATAAEAASVARF